MSSISIAFKVNVPKDAVEHSIDLEDEEETLDFIKEDVENYVNDVGSEDEWVLGVDFAVGEDGTLIFDPNFDEIEFFSVMPQETRWESANRYVAKNILETILDETSYIRKITEKESYRKYYELVKGMEVDSDPKGVFEKVKPLIKSMIVDLFNIEDDKDADANVDMIKYRRQRISRIYDYLYNALRDNETVFSIERPKPYHCYPAIETLYVEKDEDKTKTYIAFANIHI